MFGDQQRIRHFAIMQRHSVKPRYYPHVASVLDKYRPTEYDKVVNILYTTQRKWFF